MRFVSLPLVLALLASPALAGSRRIEGRRAQTEARKAYIEGVKAYADKDYLAAADAFARSDSALPKDAVLERALRAADKSDVSTLVMLLVKRVYDRDRVKRSLKLYAREVGKKHASRVGRIQVDCGSDPSCTVSIRQQTLTHGEDAFVNAGVVEVTVSSHGQTEVREVEAHWPGPTVVRAHPPKKGADGPTQFTASEVAAFSDTSAPAPASAPAPEIAAAPEPERASATSLSDGLQLTSTPERGPSSKPLKPIYFWTGVGVTAALTTGAFISGLDTKGKHDAFLQAPTRAEQDRNAGIGAQTRTNVLWIATGVAAVATAAAGIFLTDWSGPLLVGVAPSDSGGAVAVGGTW